MNGSSSIPHANSTRRAPGLIVLGLAALLCGCSGLDDVHRQILLNRITTAGETVAAADPAHASAWRTEFAAIRSDVSANLK